MLSVLGRIRDGIYVRWCDVKDALYLGRLLAHQVESGTSLEPGNLTLVEGVVKSDILRRTILVVEAHGQRLAFLEVGKTQDVNLVLRLDTVVIGRVGKGQRKHTLLLQVGLVDTSERLGDNGGTVKETGFQSSVFTGRTFTIVFITNDNPLNTTGLVVTGNIRNTTEFTSEDVLDLVSLTYNSNTYP